MAIMLDLAAIKKIGDVLEWIATLGEKEIRGVKEHIRELIGHLSASVVSLWDAAKEITRLKKSEFTKDSFNAIYDYFVGFYIQPGEISAARTHCSVVARDLERIKVKFAKALHTDLGRWEEAEGRFREIIGGDSMLLETYDASIAKLKLHLDVIRQRLDAGQISEAEVEYFKLKDKLLSDVLQMRAGISKMNEAYAHLERISG
jgi:hypothetical protein